MVLLFLLALFLAWPTAGLSIVAYIAFLVLRAYIKARTRIHFANVGNAERNLVSGKGRWPSWAGDKDQSLIFVETIQREAMRQGVPRNFLWGVLGEGNTKGLYFFAGAMEEQGASFLEQQVGCSEKLVQMWNSASPQGKRAIMAKGDEAAAAASRRAKPTYDFDDEIPF